MTLFLVFWALAGTPDGPPVTVQDPDGRWRCSITCATTGNRDAGSCHILIPGKGATEEACKTDLATKCRELAPPRGGCHWDGSQTVGK